MASEISFRLAHVAAKQQTAPDMGFHIAARAWSTSPTLQQSLAVRFPSAVVETGDKPQVAFNEQAQYTDTTAAPLSSTKSKPIVNVLALHGWLDNAATWDVLMPSLLAEWPAGSDLVVVSVDLPGHGWSSHRPALSGYPPNAYVRDMMAVVELLGWTQFGLFGAHSYRTLISGHSMGAAVSTVIAGVYPRMVSFMICVENLGPISIAAKDVAKSLQVQHTNAMGDARCISDNARRWRKRRCQRTRRLMKPSKHESKELQTELYLAKALLLDLD